MNKHAYLIIAHNEPKMLEKLLRKLDHERNDIFVHIDKKCKNICARELEKKIYKSNIIIYSEFDIKWGNKTQVLCEIDLMEKAYKYGKYQYFHLLSGVDFPIKTNEYIYNFFDKNVGKEFIHFDSKLINKKYEERIRYKHLLCDFYKISHNKLINKIIFIVDGFFTKIQKILHVQKKIPYEKLQKGCNWFSITSDMVKYVLDCKDEIFILIERSKCADEIFLQTLVINSKFKNRLYNKDYDDNYDACKRLIIWDNKKHPHTFNISDKDILKSSNAIFARKFSCQTSEQQQIVDYFLEEEEEIK